MRQMTGSTSCFNAKSNFRKILWIFAVSGLLLSVKTVFAETSGGSHKTPQEFPEFYTIEESYNLAKVNAMALLQQVDTFANQLIPNRSVPLLKWRKTNERPQSPAEAYDRKVLFPSWKKSKTSCLNVRALILMRDSQTQVQMRESGCSVESGQWYDPYSGETFTEANEIDIDHFVPLKNAYISGGWKWSKKKFCRYANFMKNTYHLLAAGASENRSKSDATPADYLPPMRSYHCEYVTRWLKIKTIWGLVMMPPEAQKIQQVIRENNCDLSKLQIEINELRENKEASEADPICDSRSQESVSWAE